MYIFDIHAHTRVFQAIYAYLCPFMCIDVYIFDIHAHQSFPGDSIESHGIDAQQRIISPYTHKHIYVVLLTKEGSNTQQANFFYNVLFLALHA